MITGLDHVVLLVRDIEAGVATYQTLLGQKPAWRSQGDGTESVLFTLDNMSVELLAPRGNGAAADHVRAAIDTNGEGLASLCFRVSDIARMHRRLDRLTLKPEPVADAESRNALGDASLSWKRTRAATETTRGVRMFFLEMSGERPHSQADASAPITGLDHVVISTTDPERAAALYGARLGLDMALDRTHPDWGRLMFFRCGDLIVEVVHRRGAEPAVHGQHLGPQLARRRYRRDARAIAGGRAGYFRSADRPQAGHAHRDRAQRHLWRAHGDAGADAAAGVILR